MAEADRTIERGGEEPSRIIPHRGADPDGRLHVLDHRLGLVAGEAGVEHDQPDVPAGRGDQLSQGLFGDELGVAELVLEQISSADDRWPEKWTTCGSCSLKGLE